MASLFCAQTGDQLVFPKDLHPYYLNIKRYAKSIKLLPGTHALIRSRSFLYHATVTSNPARGIIQIALADGSLH